MNYLSKESLSLKGDKFQEYLKIKVLKEILSEKSEINYENIKKEGQKLKSTGKNFSVCSLLILQIRVSFCLENFSA